ncbi:hypothetical protein TEA_015614 [Camellia sinensis var. sinensis]|uniref:U2A'/phosphoprotein 32 family A C-terminal domain-containing protein n=1 Tax=Camellia sinensis var. sinensis TaxID=542762 RepID=A0A4S4E4F7_CAMSN|nr:hypothetical protein TEA_015614 [Camellia sinensis var. sinensis]
MYRVLTGCRYAYWYRCTRTGYGKRESGTFGSIGYGLGTTWVCLCNTAAKRRPSNKEATHPFPLTASSDGDARRVPISKQLVLSLLASLRLPSGEKLVKIFGYHCISANNFTRYQVHIINAVPDNLTPLLIQCQSKDDDLGYHYLSNEFLPKLHTLVLTNNQLTNLVEIDPLASLPKLQFLSLLDNNITKKPNYRLYVIHKLKSLRLLDFKRVKHEEQIEAKNLFSSEEDEEQAKKEFAKTFVPGEAPSIPEDPKEEQAPKPVAPTPEQIITIKRLAGRVVQAELILTLLLFSLIGCNERSHNSIGINLICFIAITVISYCLIRKHYSLTLDVMGSPLLGLTLATLQTDHANKPCKWTMQGKEF